MIPAGESRRGRQRVEQPTHRVGILEGSHAVRGGPYLGPVARIQVPLRLRVGVHGNWVPAAALQ